VTADEPSLELTLSTPHISIRWEDMKKLRATRSSDGKGNLTRPAIAPKAISALPCILFFSTHLSLWSFCLMFIVQTTRVVVGIVFKEYDRKSIEIKTYV
jgi:hypothetical protein